MKTFIGIEYLAALALINVYKTKTETKVRMDSLNNYGIKAMKKFHEDNIPAVLLFSTEYTEQLIRDYSDCFVLKNENGEDYLELVTTIEDLMSRFVGYLTLDVLKALTSKDVVEVLCK